MNQEKFSNKFDSSDLEKELKEMQTRLRQRLQEMDAEQEKYERRQKKLPEKLYHVTTRQNAARILKEGLNPANLMFDDGEVVSLADDIDFALGVAEVTQQTSPQNLVVLEIDTQYLTPSRVHNYLRERDPENPDPIDAAAIHEVHYELTISPEAIKILK